MRNKILEYAKSQGHRTKETGGDAYEISFNAKPNFLVTITVPCFVHEWFQLKFNLIHKSFLSHLPIDPRLGL